MKYLALEVDFSYAGPIYPNELIPTVWRHERKRDELAVCDFWQAVRRNI